MNTEFNVATAIQNPALFFKERAAVLKDSRLTTKAKILILEQWERGARALMVADEESMFGVARSQSLGVSDER